MASLTGWRVIANIMLPVPVLLTVLLVVPFPRNVRKGILLFTNQVLSFPVIGGMKLVHFALLVSGLPFIDTGIRTFHSSQAAHEELRPDMKMQMLAKKWRDERNFWIAANCFLMWSLLTALFSIVNQLMRLEEKNERLQEDLDDARGIVRPKKEPANRGRVSGAVASAMGHLRGNVPHGVPAAGADDAASAPVSDAAATKAADMPAGESGTPLGALRNRAKAA